MEMNSEMNECRKWIWWWVSGSLTFPTARKTILTREHGAGPNEQTFGRMEVGRYFMHG